MYEKGLRIIQQFFGVFLSYLPVIVILSVSVLFKPTRIWSGDVGHTRQRIFIRFEQPTEFDIQRTWIKNQSGGEFKAKLTFEL